MKTATLHSAQYRPPIYLLVLLMSFASLAAVLITPALPAISSAFNISASSSTWLVTVFLLGYAIGQLPFAPLANRYGRRVAALIGLSLAFIGSLLQLLAIAEHSFTLLLLARGLCALGGGCCPVIAMTILADCYDEKGARKMMATLMLVFALMPCVAISVGGFLTSHFSWQSTLIMISIYNALILLLVYSQLNETLPESQHQKIHPLHSIRSLLAVFTTPGYIGCILLFAAGTATSYIFNSLSPELAINTLHLNPQTFGLLSIITSIGLLIGSYSAGKISHKYSAKNVIFLGVLTSLTASIVFLIFFYSNIINIYSLFIPAFFLFVGAALIIPNASMLALSSVNDKASGASSMNAANLLLTSLLVSISSHFATNHLTTLPITFLIMAIFCLLILLKIKK